MALDVRGLVRGGLNLAFDLMPLSVPGAPNVQRTVTYSRIVGASYDPLEGEVTSNTVEATINVLIATYSEQEVDGVMIEVGDEKVVVRMADLIAEGILTAGKDDIVRESGEQDRQVIAFTLDPTGQALILQVRKVKGIADASASSASTASN